MKIFESIKNAVFPTYSLSEQEKLIMEVFNKVINFPSTNKILYRYGSAFFSNDELGIYISIDANTVTILNDKDCFSLDCSGKFMMMLSDFIDKSIDSSIETIKAKLVEHQNDLLKDINNTIIYGAEEK